MKNATGMMNAIVVAYGIGLRRTRPGSPSGRHTAGRWECRSCSTSIGTRPVGMALLFRKKENFFLF